MPQRWTTPQKLLAYAILVALAGFSIWLVDRKVRVLPPRDATQNGDTSRGSPR